MFMVGSLVFFVIEITYRGGFESRLCWIMGLFVFAAVLIGRISIEEGREHAALFAIALGVATAITTTRFVQFEGLLSSLGPLAHLGFIGLIWWCADKLTWDCTVIDEHQDLSGEGLLQTAGMDGESAEEDPQHDPLADMEATTSSESPPRLSWWQKFVEYRRRPHAPGVWVLYFSLAALPIFGFGQWFAPQDRESRRYVFQLLVVYLAAGLGLLVTTSFLGLRRYLRQRRLEMPTQMAASWLGLGAAIIVAVLVFCLLLPRRNPEYSVTDLPAFAGSPDLDPSDWGMGPDGPQTDEADRSVADPDGESVSDEPGQDPSSSGQGDSDADQGQAESEQSGDRSGDTRSSSGSGERSGQQQQTEQPQNNPPEKQGESPEADSTAQQPESTDQQNAEDQQRSDREPSRSSNSRRANNRQFDMSRTLDRLGQGLGGLLKVLYWIAVIAILGFLVWRYWSQILQAVREFVQSLRDFWARLMGRETQEPPEIAEQVPEAARHRRFAEFSDPFLTGMAEQYSPQELIGYSFEALEAWARDHNCARQPEQTPHEFARTVTRRTKSFSKEAARLAELYCWTAYGCDDLPAASREHLRRFWQVATASSTIPEP